VIVHAPRNTDFATLDQSLEPSSYVHSVAEDVVVLDHDVANIDAHSKAHPASFRLVFVCSLKSRLYLDSAANGVEHARELGEDAIAGGVRDTASCCAMSSSTTARQADNVAIVASSSPCIRRL
jgi:hypothetical protein